MRLQERFLSGVRNDTDQRKIVIRCDKKTIKIFRSIGIKKERREYNSERMKNES